MRVGLGLAVAVTAAAWLVGEGRGLALAFHKVADVLPLLLIAGGIALLIASTVPVHRVVGPGLLVSTGCLVLLARSGWFQTTQANRVIPSVCLVVGAALVLHDVQKMDSEQRKIRTFLWSRRYKAKKTPARLTVTVVLGAAQLNLEQAQAPAGGQARFFIRVFGGRVEVRVPRAWQVSAGDLSALHAVRLKGDLDTNVDEASEPEPAGDLLRSSAARGRIAGQRRLLLRHLLPQSHGGGQHRPSHTAEGAERPRVILDVAGAVGAVEIIRV